MPARCVSLALLSCVRGSRVFLQQQGRRSRGAHGPATPPSWLLSSRTAVSRVRALSSSGSTPGDGEAAPAAAAAAVGDSKLGGDFPWRTAPDQFVEPMGSGSFLDGIMEAIFHEFCLKGVDFTTGAEAAFVTTAAAYFRMSPSEVRAPKPVEGEKAAAAVAAAAAAETEAAAATVVGAEGASSTGDAGEKPSAAAPAPAADPAAEKQPSAETSEEEVERVLAAIDSGLVALSGDKEGVPFYRLHSVVAKAITRKKYILGVRRGDDLSNRFSVSMSPSLDIVLEENKAFAQIKNTLAGNATITFQVDVDVDCDETFYVKDKESGEVIQGKEESAGRRHRVRLESHHVLSDQSIEQPHVWKVVDLDNWLKGNAFW